MWAPGSGQRRTGQGVLASFSFPTWASRRRHEELLSLVVASCGARIIFHQTHHQPKERKCHSAQWASRRTQGLLTTSYAADEAPPFLLLFTAARERGGCSGDDLSDGRRQKRQSAVWMYLLSWILRETCSQPACMLCTVPMYLSPDGRSLGLPVDVWAVSSLDSIAGSS